MENDPIEVAVPRMRHKVLHRLGHLLAMQLDGDVAEARVQRRGGRQRGGSRGFRRHRQLLFRRLLIEHVSPLHCARIEFNKGVSALQVSLASTMSTMAMVHEHGALYVCTIAACVLYCCRACAGHIAFTTGSG